MVEWQNGGMAEWQKGGMAEWYFTTYLIYPAIFMVHADDDDDDDTDTFKSFTVLMTYELALRVQAYP
jgi:hypothetical protein